MRTRWTQRRIRNANRRMELSISIRYKRLNLSNNIKIKRKPSRIGVTNRRLIRFGRLGSKRESWFMEDNINKFISSLIQDNSIYTLYVGTHPRIHTLWIETQNYERSKGGGLENLHTKNPQKGWLRKQFLKRDLCKMVVGNWLMG